MPEARLEKTRRLYDRVIDLWPMGCKVLDVGTPDNVALNAVFEKRRFIVVGDDAAWAIEDFIERGL